MPKSGVLETTLRSYDKDATFWSSSQSKCSDIKSSLMLADSISTALPAQFRMETEDLADPTTFDESIHLQVRRIICAYGDYVDEISTRYFQGIHRWLPVISRQLFHDRLVSFRGPMTADFSVLLLSMCLVTRHPSAISRGTDNNLETLYLTTKMLFAHIQATLPTSTNLVQAALLITIYEYGHGLTDAAYISIGTCARMALTAGLQKTKLNQILGGGKSWLKEEEERNLWWGIILSDRFIASETTSADKPLATQLLNPDDDLPLDLDLVERKAQTDAVAFGRQPVHAFHSEMIGSFGREAQAAYLYARVLETVETKSPVVQQFELLQMDSILQAFFITVTSQSAATWGLHCGSISITICALFTLHEYILGHSGTVSELETLHKSSKSALSTLAKIVVDVARSFNKHIPDIDVETLPPRTLNFVRTAHYLLANSGDAYSKECYADIDEIRTMMRYLSRRWKIVGKHLETLEMHIKTYREPNILGGSG
ncbi:hypothetical protein MMC11_006863 [Xylographa trunciseda]|nr:hypothetical protein [Xylographa trunciseda]